MLEEDDAPPIQGDVAQQERGWGGAAARVRLVEEEIVLTPRGARDRPIGTPDRPTFEDPHASVATAQQGESRTTPNSSLTNRMRVGDRSSRASNPVAPTTPIAATDGEEVAATPPPTNRAAEALQREINRQRGGGGAGGAARGERVRGRGRPGAHLRNRNGRPPPRGGVLPNDDPSDGSSGDDDNNPNANEEGGTPTGNGGPASSPPQRPKRNRLSNGDILTRPHVVLQSYNLPAATTAAIDPPASQPNNYYGRPYGEANLNVGKPIMRQAITLDSDWKFPLFPGGCSVTACFLTRCEIVRLWGQHASSEIEGGRTGIAGLCCGLLAGHNVDGQYYRQGRVLEPLRSPTTRIGAGSVGGGECAMSHGGNSNDFGEVEMQPVGSSFSSPPQNGGGHKRSGGPSTTSSEPTDSSSRMLCMMIVLDVLTLGIPCGPFYNGMGTALYGCWSRWQVRRKYRIEGYGWQDCCVMCCFPGCALNQHRQEIEFNQILLSSFRGSREMM